MMWIQWSIGSGILAGCGLTTTRRMLRLLMMLTDDGCIRAVWRWSCCCVICVVCQVHGRRGRGNPGRNYRRGSTQESVQASSHVVV